MKKTIYILLFVFSCFTHAQTQVQSINTSSILSSSHFITVGEIVVTPVTQFQSDGLLAIVAQINNQQLEVSELELVSGITVFPNPTSALLHFKSDISLLKESVLIYDTTGRLVQKSALSQDNSVDLSTLPVGTFIIQLESINKTFTILKK